MLPCVSSHWAAAHPASAMICQPAISSAAPVVQGVHDSVFTSIPATFYWCIVTLMTVGYGDMVPVTPLGKLAGSACMLSSILIIALPISVIGSNFQQHWNDHKAKQKAQDRTARVWPIFQQLLQALQRQEQASGLGYMSTVQTSDAWACALLNSRFSTRAAVLQACHSDL